MSIPVTPRRTEPLLLPKLRELFPGVTFDTIERSDLEPPFTEARVTSSASSPMQWVAGCRPWRYASYILLARSSGLMTRIPVLPGSSA